MNRRIVILGLLSKLVRVNDDDTIQGYIDRGEPVPAGTYHMTRTINASGGRFISTGSTYYLGRAGCDLRNNGFYSD